MYKNKEVETRPINQSDLLYVSSKDFQVVSVILTKKMESNKNTQTLRRLIVSTVALICVFSRHSYSYCGETLLNLVTEGVKTHFTVLFSKHQVFFVSIKCELLFFR